MLCDPQGSIPYFSNPCGNGAHGYTPTPMAGIDAEVVKHALKVARDNGFAEVEIANGESSFRATLEPSTKKAKAKAAQAALDKAAEPVSAPIKSTQVGYYRPAATPLAVGQVVEKGQIVATISALGLANDVESTVAGEITEVLVSDGDPVQFGQALALVKL